ncbi:MAG: hypothetical protein V7L12_06400 [Nostoc sp.]
MLDKISVKLGRFNSPKHLKTASAGAASLPLSHNLLMRKSSPPQASLINLCASAV